MSYPIALDDNVVAQSNARATRSSSAKSKSVTSLTPASSLGSASSSYVRKYLLSMRDVPRSAFVKSEAAIPVTTGSSSASPLASDDDDHLGSTPAPPPTVSSGSTQVFICAHCSIPITKSLSNQSQSRTRTRLHGPMCILQSIASGIRMSPTNQSCRIPPSNLTWTRRFW
jgi:hypothetical protein